MNDRPLPMWELAGFDQMTYKNLPWPEKRVLIRRYQGTPVFEFNGRQLWKCPACGYKITDAARFCPGATSDCCPKCRIHFPNFVKAGKADEAMTMECRFVPDCLPHNAKNLRGTSNITWWPHAN